MAGPFYGNEYVASRGKAVASSLPVREAPYRREGGAVPPFFAGLLPEGARLQAVIDAVVFHISSRLRLLTWPGQATTRPAQINHGQERYRALHSTQIRQSRVRPRPDPTALT